MFWEWMAREIRRRWWAWKDLVAERARPYLVLNAVGNSAPFAHQYTTAAKQADGDGEAKFATAMEQAVEWTERAEQPTYRCRSPFVVCQRSSAWK